MMIQKRGLAVVVAIVAVVLISVFLLGGCGQNPVSSSPNHGAYSGGTVDGKGTKGGNVAASATVPADTVLVSAAN
jgi:major membrane immunogen (membrane-anchored lipoprotein)